MEFRFVAVRWQPDLGQSLSLHLSSGQATPTGGQIAYKRLKQKALCEPVRSSVHSTVCFSLSADLLGALVGKKESLSWVGSNFIG